MRGVSGVEELKATNNLLSHLLQVGQRLRIPTTTSTRTYTIKSRDKGFMGNSE